MGKQLDSGGWFPDIDDDLEYKPVTDGSYSFVYDEGFDIFWILHQVGRSSDERGNYVFIYEVCNPGWKYDGLRFDIPLTHLKDAPQFCEAGEYQLMPREINYASELRDTLRDAMRLWRGRNEHNNKVDGFEWLED